MSFFKADLSLTKESNTKPSADKLRYVIDADGKGRWIRPDKYRYSIPYHPSFGYDEDVPF